MGAFLKAWLRNLLILAAIVILMAAFLWIFYPDTLQVFGWIFQTYYLLPLISLSPVWPAVAAAVPPSVDDAAAAVSGAAAGPPAAGPAVGPRWTSQRPPR